MNDNYDSTCIKNDVCDMGFLEKEYIGFVEFIYGEYK